MSKISYERRAHDDGHEHVYRYQTRDEIKLADEYVARLRLGECAEPLTGGMWDPRFVCVHCFSALEFVASSSRMLGPLPEVLEFS